VLSAGIPAPNESRQFGGLCNSPALAWARWARPQPDSGGARGAWRQATGDGRVEEKSESDAAKKSVRGALEQAAACIHPEAAQEAGVRPSPWCWAPGNRGFCSVAPSLTNSRFFCDGGQRMTHKRGWRTEGGKLGRRGLDRAGGTRATELHGARPISAPVGYQYLAGGWRPRDPAPLTNGARLPCARPERQRSSMPEPETDLLPFPCQVARQQQTGQGCVVHGMPRPCHGRFAIRRVRKSRAVRRECAWWMKRPSRESRESRDCTVDASPTFCAVLQGPLPPKSGDGAARGLQRCREIYLPQLPPLLASWSQNS